MKYNNVAFKASHNSYDRDESLATQLTFDPNNPANAGCSQIELDIWQGPNPNTNGWEWSVSHKGPYDSNPDKQFSAYLQQVMDWRAAAPGSDPYHNRVIAISIDIKDTSPPDDDFPDAIDNYIRGVIPESLVYKPCELIGGKFDDLVSGAQATGWPEIETLNNKYILCFSGDEDRKKAYAETSPKDRLCFADQTLRTDHPTEYPSFVSGNRVFMNYHLYQDSYKKYWCAQLQAMAEQPGFITRGYVLNDGDIWADAQNAKLNIMATDKITGKKYDWAQNGPYPFRAL
jgi:hypothetical protein